MSYHNIIITAFCSQMQSAVFISKFIRHPEQNGVAQYWDWPSKKGARERTDMDWLKDILGDAHTEDIDKKIASYIGKNFVSKSDFRAESDKVKNLEDQIAERDGQLEELKKVDTSGLHPHLLRHSFATRYLENGGDIYSLQLILGHTSLEMVKKYVHLIPSKTVVNFAFLSPLDNALKK